MWIQNLIRLGTGLGLAVALLALVACHEANGTKQIPGTYPPESEIDRNYPTEVPEPDASVNADTDAENGGDADTNAVADSGAGTNS